MHYSWAWMNGRRASPFAWALLTGFVGLTAAAAEYDLVIRGGRIVDGSGNPWFHGDVAIRADRIAQIGRVPAGSGQRDLDAHGLIVAPGFIDMHSHSDY